MKRIRSKNLLFFLIILICAFALITTELSYVNNTFLFLELILISIIYLNNTKYHIKKLPVPILIYSFYLLLRIIVHLLNSTELINIRTDYHYQFNLISDIIIVTILVASLYGNTRTKKFKTILISLTGITLVVIFSPYLINVNYASSVEAVYKWSDLKIRLILANLIYTGIVIAFFKYTKKYMYNMGFFVQSFIIILTLAHINETMSHLNTILLSVQEIDNRNQVLVYTKAYINFVLLLFMILLFLYRLFYRELSSKIRALTEKALQYINYVFLAFFVLTIPFTLAENLYVLLNGLVVILFALTIVISYFNHQQIRLNRSEVDQLKSTRNEEIIRK